MKKVLFLMIVSLFSMNLSAQVMRAEELEKYAKENYGDKWVDAAENLGSPPYFTRWADSLHP